MGSLQVDRKEWEDFLNKLSELEKKYQLVLHELDTAHSKLQALENSQKHESASPVPFTTPPTSTQEKRTAQTATREKKPRFLSRLKTDLRSFRISTSVGAGRSVFNPNAPPNYASCSRCGSKILFPRRFCGYCGADFGQAVCSCGRAVSAGVTFCNHCGRRIADAL